MDKKPLEKENDTDQLIKDLSRREENLSELSELASTAAVIPLDIPASKDVSGKKAQKISGKKTKKRKAASAAADAAPAAASVPVHQWFVTLMCMNIPIIGWIYLAVLACSRSKGPRRDFAKAYLLYKLVFLILALAILSVVVYYGLEVLDKVLAYMEML